MRSRCRYNQGFSLLEMTVVLAIVAIMTAISLWNMPRIKGGLSIDIVAQELAIYVRGAQVYSRATKITRGESAEFESSAPFHSFGMHFEKDKGEFFLWSDTSDLSREDLPEFSYLEGASLVEERYSLPSGYVISGLFTNGACGGEGNKDQSYEVADVLFKRPDPEAFFACNNVRPIGGVCNDPCRQGSNLYVALTSPNKAQTRYIRVSSNGQIIVTRNK